MCFYIPNKPPCTCVFLQLVQPCNGARLYPSTNPANPNPIIQVCGTRILARGAGQRYCHQCAARHGAVGATATTTPTTTSAVGDSFTNGAPTHQPAGVESAHKPGTLTSYSCNGGSTASRGAQASAHPTSHAQLPLRPRRSADNKTPVNRNLAELKGKGRTSPRHRRQPSGSQKQKQIPRSVPMSDSSVSSTSSTSSQGSNDSSGSDQSMVIPSITITTVPTTVAQGCSYYAREIGWHGTSGDTNGYAHPYDTPTVAHVVEPCIESDQTGEGTLMSYGDVRFLVDLPDDERRHSNEDDGCA